MLSFLRRRPLDCAVAVFLVILAVQALLKRESEWQLVFVDAGRQWWQGFDIYHPGSSFLYPPFQAMLATPFDLLPEWLSRLAWLAMSFVGLAVMVTAAWRVSGGGPLRRLQLAERREWFVFAIGLACSLSYALNSFAHQQTDVILGGLLMAGAWAVVRGRDAIGGSLIGLAAAFKATPLLFGPYLLMRRRWISAFFVGVVFMTANLLPDLVPSPTGQPRIVKWAIQYVVPLQRPDVDLGWWGSLPIYNQSLGGTAERLTNTRLELTRPNVTVKAERTISTGVLKSLVYGLFLAMIVISIAAATRARRNMPDGRPSPGPMPLEISIVLTLMLLMSPMSGAAHFSILILPAFCLARIAIIQRDKVLGAIVAMVAVPAIIFNKDIVGTFTSDVVRWIGQITFSTLLLWAGCVSALYRGQRAPATVPAPLAP